MSFPLIRCEAFVTLRARCPLSIGALSNEQQVFEGTTTHTKLDEALAGHLAGFQVLRAVLMEVHEAQTRQVAKF